MSGPSLTATVSIERSTIEASLFQDGHALGKSTSSEVRDVKQGVKEALMSLMKLPLINDEFNVFKEVRIGPNIFQDALSHRQNLAPVAVLRVGEGNSRFFEPCIDFPCDLRKVAYHSHFFLSGGHDVDGQEKSAIKQEEVIDAISKLRANNVTNIAVSCEFSLVNGSQEEQVREILRKHYPEASVTLSHEIGKMALLERENAAILNESLKPLCRTTIQAFQEALAKLDLKFAEISLGGDGRKISPSEATGFPFNVFSSGTERYIRKETMQPSIGEGPKIDLPSGEWILDEKDIEYIAIGACLLGSGGGGNPHLGKALALQQLRRGKKMAIIAPERFGTTPPLDGKAVFVGAIGSPIVIKERLLSGLGSLRAVETLQDVLKANQEDVGEQIGQSDDGDEANGLVCIADYKLCSPRAEPSGSGDRITAIMPFEIGGLNIMEPLFVGSELGLPVIDCDGVGKAVPELQMLLPAIPNKSLCPSAVANHDGSKKAVVLEATKVERIENWFRKIASDEMGGAGGYAISILTKEEVYNKTVHYSFSRTWQIGYDVISACTNGSDPIEAITKRCNGVLLFRGKIAKVKQTTEGGFDAGNVTVEGNGEYEKQSLLVLFKNENYLAKKYHVLSGVEQELVVAMTPDVIVAVNPETGRAIPNDEIQPGLQAAIIALPSPPSIRSPEALRVVGPRAYGLDIDYVAVGDFPTPTPIPPKCSFMNE